MKFEGILKIWFFLSLLIFVQSCGADDSNGECLLNSDCGENSYCQFSDGKCGKGEKEGHCEVRPDFCTMEYDPVCGCDLVLYSNACRAAGSGVSVSEETTCLGNKN